MLDIFDKYPLIIESPISGKWTTVANEGFGIADLVLSNDAPIINMEVHENQTLGGSDHRPITFELQIGLDIAKWVARWNIAKFRDGSYIEKYQNRLLPCVFFIVI